MNGGLDNDTMFRLDVKERLEEYEKRLNCHARRIVDLNERMAFCGKLTVVALAFSVIALALSVVF